MNKKNDLTPFKARVAAANVRVVARAVRSTAEPAPKVSIRDHGATEDMLFADVEEYLVETGWDFEGQLGDRQIVTYRKGDREVLVGRNDSFADRPQVIAQIIGIVAEVEKRSELEVYWDVRAARHGTEGAGFVVLPHDGTLVSARVTVEAPVPLYPADRLTFYAIAVEGQDEWTLTDNGHVAEQMDPCVKLGEHQLDLVDRALRAVNPIFSNASWDGGELALEVDTCDLGAGLVMFSQLCALLGLICWTEIGATEKEES